MPEVPTQPFGPPVPGQRQKARKMLGMSSLRLDIRKKDAREEKSGFGQNLRATRNTVYRPVTSYEIDCGETTKSCTWSARHSPTARVDPPNRKNLAVKVEYSDLKNRLKVDVAGIPRLATRSRCPPGELTGGQIPAIAGANKNKGRTGDRQTPPAAWGQLPPVRTWLDQEHIEPGRGRNCRSHSPAGRGNYSRQGGGRRID